MCIRDRGWDSVREALDDDDDMIDVYKRQVYDRPNRTLPPAWVLILLALLVLAGLWLVFTYVFS